MNIFTKAALALVATASFASVAVAAPGDGLYGSVVRAKAQVNTLEHKLENRGVQVNHTVNLSSANTPLDKAQLLNDRAQQLQMKLNEVKSQHS